MGPMALEHVFNFTTFRTCFDEGAHDVDSFLSQFGKMFQLNGKVGVFLSMSQNGYFLEVSWLSTKSAFQTARFLVFFMIRCCSYDGSI